jgi:ParB family chromosome partitioning protein
MTTTKKTVLGKGIASLIDTSEIPSEIRSFAMATEASTENGHGPKQGILMVGINLIKTNPSQPRKIFKEKELAELANSIRENGIIQPLIVSKTDKGFELIAGERRLKAARIAGLSQVPVIVKMATDRDKMVMSIIENVQRSDLNCVEEALAYYQLMDEYKLTQEDVAKKVGKERSTVANFLRILKLPRIVIDLLQKEQLSFGHAKVLAAVEPDRVESLAAVAVKQNLSVRELERLLGRKGSEKAAVPNDEFDYFRQKLEERTGFRFKLKGKNGKGVISIKFRDKKEFNTIYEYFFTSSSSSL